MLSTSRFFEAGQAYRLCFFEVAEGDEWAPPTGSTIVHVEPIIATDEDSQTAVVEGLYLWALVPSNKMTELVGEALQHGR